MKLRLQGDSLRLRLTRPEVQTLCETGRVAETTRFAPECALTCVLEVTKTADALHARFDGRTVVVQVPAAWADGWAGSERVGFEGEQPLPGGAALALLVEKDFECLHRDANDPDAFAHPAQQRAA